MNQFKEIVFVKIKGVQGKLPQRYSIKYPIQQLTSQLRKLIQWTTYQDKYDLKITFMNFQNRSIFNNGIVIREHSPDQYSIELITNTPTKQCFATCNTPLQNLNNFVNFKCETTYFQSDPSGLFQSFGYKQENQFEHRQLQYFQCLKYGVEAIIYPKTGYLQLIETFPAKIEVKPENSISRLILQKIGDFLEADQNIQMILSKMRPQNFD